VYGNLGEFHPIPDAGDKHNAFISKYRVRQVACYNCTIRCKHGIQLPEGIYSVIKCVP